MYTSILFQKKRLRASLLVDVKNKRQMQSWTSWNERKEEHWSAECIARGHEYAPRLMQELAAERAEAQRLAGLRAEAQRAEAQRAKAEEAQRLAERRAEARRAKAEEAQRLAERDRIEAAAWAENQRLAAERYHAAHEEGQRVSAESIAESRRQIGLKGIVLGWGRGIGII